MLTVSIGGKVYEIAVTSEVPIDRRETIRYGEKEIAESAYISLSSSLPPAEDSNSAKKERRELLQENAHVSKEKALQNNLFR